MRHDPGNKIYKAWMGLPEQEDVAAVLCEE